jgi:hypothetical protein
MRETTDQRVAEQGFEFVKLTAVDKAGDDFMHIIGRAHILRDQAVEILGGVERRAWVLHRHMRRLLRAKVADDIAQDGDGMVVPIGQMVRHARGARVQFRPAQRFGVDILARRGLHQRRPGQKDRALFAHDHRLVAHGGT